jgi:hypothetical protein
MEALPTKSQQAPNRLLQRLMDFDNSSTDNGDEYQRYLKEPRLNIKDQDFDPLSWWLEPSQRTRFPHLSKMAIDLLSAPAMSADNERLFSIAKQTVDDTRTQLDPRALEALLCLKSWQKFN